ncbi:cytochrome b-561 transmembrane protein [Stenotrophomonas acidaminiphila]|uniref:Cytochrome b-561 transmembrane protein n=1 Tax=Stenotrophomonas acidaminiphila TaxID=128780 RepID=A0A0S1B3P6_9GAMM|nr:cytochrome b [Stenotrophomonas acidaminiphila]ALJ29704.1 cytochrome b-561 transmembrane protein [Stenotrophomonas acidaminiphila]
MKHETYNRWSIGLHWLMLLLFVLAYASIELRGIFEKGTAQRELMKSAHFSMGLAILALVWVRMIARMLTTTPPIVPAPPAWQRWAATAVHLLLYVFMIAQPLLGWLVLSAAGKPVPFFGLALPPLVATDTTLAGTLKELHETLGSVGYWLIGIHALAALLHHYVMKDNTLRRMMPSAGRHAGAHRA